MARRAVKPVPMPKSIRPGAIPFNVAKALAVTAAMRFDGTRTPVPRRIREVLSAAAAIATKQSPVIICVSKNQACVKPSSSALCASFHESLPVAMPIPKSIPVSDYRATSSRNTPEQFHAIMLGEKDVRPDCDFVLDRHRPSLHSSKDYTAQAQRGDRVGSDAGQLD